VLLATVDPRHRRGLTDALRGEGVETALASNAPQAVERATVVCSESAWRWKRPSDFDLVLIEAAMVEWPLDFVCCLREAGYWGPVVALDRSGERYRDFLEADILHFAISEGCTPAGLVSLLQDHPEIAPLLMHPSRRERLRR
jgi:CheY-like chemotaxis protein